MRRMQKLPIRHSNRLWLVAAAGLNVKELENPGGLGVQGCKAGRMAGKSPGWDGTTVAPFCCTPGSGRTVDTVP